MRVDAPTLLLGALAAVLLVSVVVAASTSSAAFGVYNPAWDGADDLRGLAEQQDANASVALNATSYDRAPPDRTVAVVLAPSEPYGDDADRVRRFVRAGGTLVVAEDFDRDGNELLRAVGADARVDGRLLRDERSNYRSPALPVATNVSRNASGNVTAGVDSVTLNHGSVVAPNGSEVLVASSEFGYLDANRNGELDDGERLRSYPVATVEPVGEGRVVVVSDPSAFVNAMLERPGNERFARNLLARERVLLDYSHAGPQPPLTVALLRLRDSAAAQGAVAALAVGGVFVGGRFWRRRGGDEAPGWRSPDAVAAYLASERGWDRDRAKRLAEGVWGPGGDETDDE